MGTLASDADAGPVILGGDDLTDHGSVSGGVNQAGWLYIERAIADLDAKATRPGGVGIAVLGAAPSTATYSDAGAAIGSAAAAAGVAPVSYYEGATALSSFFANLAVGNVNPKIIWIAGSEATNDLSPAEGAVLSLAANAVALDVFVASGGGLMSHGAGPTVYGWLPTLLPGAIETLVCRSPVSLTTAGATQFPSLSNGNVSAGPCHSTFSGNLGGLQVLAVDVVGRAVIIGGDDVTISSVCPQGNVTVIDYQSLEQPNVGPNMTFNHLEDGFRTMTPFGVNLSSYGTQHMFYAGSTAVFVANDWVLTRDNTNLSSEFSTGLARTPFDLIGATLTELTDPSAGSVTFTGLQGDATSSTLNYTLDGSFGPDPEVTFSSAFDRTVRLEFDGGQQIDDVRICKHSCRPSLSDVVAWWSADDCGAADSQSINHGSLVGGSSCSGAVGFPGVRHRMVGAAALPLTATNYVEVTNPTGFVRDLSQGDLTIDAWVLMGAVSDLRPVIERGGDPGYKLSVGRFGGGGTMAFEVRDGGHFYLSASIPLVDDGFWHHVAVRFDQGAGTATFYVDGAAYTPIFLLLDTLGAADQLLIGRDQAGTPFEGWIDELHLYKRALSAAEIASIFGAGTAGVCRPSTVISIGGTSAATSDVRVGFGPPGKATIVELQVPTTPGQSGSTVAANLAAAINADASLQALGIFAVANQGRIDIGGGVVHGASTSDPGLEILLGAPAHSEEVGVPALTPLGRVGLCAAFVVLGWIAGLSGARPGACVRRRAP